jgi:meso-butanediol dehydrogenase / (S,S)-butanediol dehydrogenase / diacetyl reductase
MAGAPTNRTDGRLVGKVALISGTAGGQGREAARIFAREGARVVACDINADGAGETARIVKSEGGELVSVAPLDLSVRSAAAAWIDAAMTAFGQIDILYNNASLPRFGPVGEMSDEDWSFTMRNEVDLVWYCCQEAWPHMVAGGGGAIVNIASVSARLAMRRLPQAAHAAAKGAVVALTRQLAAEGAAVNIRANAVSPGVIASPATEEMLAMGESSPIRPIVDHTAFGRAGRPVDVVYAALFLASDEAAFVNGADLVVDGGSSILI